MNQLKVRKRPLNKKEIAKKEEDIISIEQASNCLTVHETKLKVSYNCASNYLLIFTQLSVSKPGMSCRLTLQNMLRDMTLYLMLFWMRMSQMMR